MASIRDIVVDCRHPAALARFWSAALDGYEVAPYDDAELARLDAMGMTDPNEDPTVLLESPGTVPRYFFQRVEEPKAGKNRVHLDLESDDPEAELARLLELGATVVADRRVEEHWVTLADPEGNEFCLIF